MFKPNKEGKGFVQPALRGSTSQGTGSTQPHISQSSRMQKERPGFFRRPPNFELPKVKKRPSGFTPSPNPWAKSGQHDTNRSAEEESHPFKHSSKGETKNYSVPGMSKEELDAISMDCISEPLTLENELLSAEEEYDKAGIHGGCANAPPVLFESALHAFKTEENSNEVFKKDNVQLQDRIEKCFQECRLNFLREMDKQIKQWQKNLLQTIFKQQDYHEEMKGNRK